MVTMTQLRQNCVKIRLQTTSARTPEVFGMSINTGSTAWEQLMRSETAVNFQKRGKLKKEGIQVTDGLQTNKQVSNNSYACELRIGYKNRSEIDSVVEAVYFTTAFSYIIWG